MPKKRLIARLDIKNNYLIKGIHLEGLRKLGTPDTFAGEYFSQGVDELIFMDAVASLYQRNNLMHIVSQAAENIFVPITVGGGLRKLDDVKAVLRSGADKVAINTAAVAKPKFLSEVARECGVQCVVLSVEAKSVGDQLWEVYTDNGRERTGVMVDDWVKQCLPLGVGEILLTSVDREGTCCGLDIELCRMVRSLSTVPVVASGGVGCLSHIQQGFDVDMDGIALAHLLHYRKSTVSEIRDYCLDANLDVRAR
ncbi:imidazole glycerol phosphate synthase subunit HisF [Dongshaea marina]|uniref:imidazole glycerol phosphate synthase subunit HisF n=1 Tax=Dongshaea marina TaxID=2047966 RepID=UPI000D3E635D|nr:imidazole glycerol phosphate synthase cyclase subunit [Dongshaea marina]